MAGMSTGTQIREMKEEEDEAALHNGGKVKLLFCWWRRQRE